jgi:DNA-binding transcriptional ArsR family regulator
VNTIYNRMVMYAAPQSKAASDTLDAVFGALADPTRRAILARLTTGVRSVSELAEPFEMSQPAISKHLKVLEKAGLVVKGKDAQWRPRSIQAEPLKEANAYLEQYRKLWDERLDRLEVYLGTLQKDR